MSTLRVGTYANADGTQSTSAANVSCLFSDNKYTNWYFSIVNKAKQANRVKYAGEYYERHHIIPKSLSGNNSPDNLILLTAKEHFVCHLLLTKMVGKKYRYKMTCAVSKMAFQVTKKQQRKLTSGEYSLARSLLSKAQSERCKGLDPWNKGKTAANDPRVAENARKTIATKSTRVYRLTDEQKQKISDFHRGSKRKPLSNEHKLKLSEMRKGVSRGKHSQETKIKQGGAEYHNPLTGETKRFKIHLGEVVPSNWVKGRFVTDPTIWVTNGVKNIRCKLSNDIPAGWYRGRTANRATNGMFMESA